MAKDDDKVPDKKGRDLKTYAMVLWTRRSAFFLAFCAFIAMFLVSFDFGAYSDVKVIIISTVKGLGAALLFWLAGLIIGNIFLKGLITDVPADQEHLLEGGLLQRIYLYQERLNHDMDANVIQVDPVTEMIVRKKPEDSV
jgi:hypothetical protein